MVLRKCHEPQPVRNTKPASSGTRRMTARLYRHASAPSCIQSPERETTKPHKTIFSPRILMSDRDLFPKLHLEQYEIRHQYLSELAGPHKQPLHTKVIDTKYIHSPEILMNGMPKRAARLVKTLFLPIVGSPDFPLWLDVILKLFPNLQHLHISDPSSAVASAADGNSFSKQAATPLSSNAGNSSDQPQQDPPSDEVSVRRLYVLYRMPKLSSLDSVEFTPAERALARPVTQPSLLDEEDEELLKKSAVELSITGSVVEPPLMSRDVYDDEEDFLDTLSVTSTTVNGTCVWGCGTLSLPYFRRKNNPYREQQQFTFDPIDNQEISFEPPEMTEVLPPERLVKASERTTRESPERAQRVAAKKSLTSPFPLHFRVPKVSPHKKKRRSPPDPPALEPLASLETIEVPVTFTRSQSSPTFIKHKRGERPPQFPGARRTILSPNRQVRLKARFNSIIDDEEDDSDSDSENLIVS